MEYSLSQRLGGFSPKPFDPSQVTGGSLELWLDASDGVYIGGVLVDPSVTTVGAVDAWKDKSPNGYWLTQTILNNRPAYDDQTLNKPTISFDGSNDFLISTSDKAGTTPALFSITGDSPRTIISVYRRRDNNQKWVVAWGVSSAGTLFSITQEYYIRCAGGVTKDYTNVGTNNQQTIFYVNGTGDDLDSYDIYVDGGTSPTAANGTSSGSTTLNTLASQITIGAFVGGVSGYAFGYLSELLIYDGNPTADERAKLFKYLNDKYSVY